MKIYLDSLCQVLREFLFTLARRIIRGASYRTPPMNIVKTVWFNIIAFPFKQALLFPVWIYNHTSVHKVGTFRLDTVDIYSGMVRIGSEGNVSRNESIIENHGLISIRGSLSIFRGCYILNTGEIIFHGSNRLAEGVTLKITEGLDLGYMSRFGTECYVIDSDFHFTINIQTHVIKRSNARIQIGDYNWFGTRTFIKKGAKTPSHIIVAAPNALLTKDYSDIPAYTVLGGAPVKPIAYNVRRIYNIKEEIDLAKYFKTHPDNNDLNVNISDNEMDKFCDSNSIRL